jgi:hypothetical protein
MGADKTEVNSEDIEMEEDGNGEEEENTGPRKNKNRARQPIFHNANSDNKFFMQLGFALLLLLGYFVAMLVISIQYTSRI